MAVSAAALHAPVGNVPGPASRAARPRQLGVPTISVEEMWTSVALATSGRMEICSIF